MDNGISTLSDSEYWFFSFLPYTEELEAYINHFVSKSFDSSNLRKFEPIKPVPPVIATFT